VPGIRILRQEGKGESFDIYFCKTKYKAYKILMGPDREKLEGRMAERSTKDPLFQQNMKRATVDMAHEYRGIAH